MKKRIVHFEIGCSNIAETADFYRTIFDWKIEQKGNSATINTGTENDIPGHLNKLASDEPQNYVTVYIETDSLNSDLETIESNGGEIFVKPIKLPDGREFAWFKDVVGNLIGLITPK